MRRDVQMTAIPRKLGSRRTLLALAGLGAIIVALPALASDEVHRYAVVEATDLVRKTVTLRGEEYQVSPRTQLQDAAGKRIPLAQLIPLKSTKGFFRVDGATAVEFRALLVRRSWVLLSLRIVPKLPD
jgi:hypothetical protein